MSRMVMLLKVREGLVQLLQALRLLQQVRVLKRVVLLSLDGMEQLGKLSGRAALLLREPLRRT